MVAEQKIEEAECFLDKITQALTRKDFIPNLSAFLSATRSIPDYLLEDYNTKLGLNIPLTEKLYIDTAINQGNQIAQRFIIEYKTQLNNIYNNPLGKLLTTKRNISIHRTGVPIQGRIKRVIHETINISDSVGIEVRHKYGNLKMRSEPTKSEKKPELHMTETLPDNTLLQNSDGVEWYFDDYQN